MFLLQDTLANATTIEGLERAFEAILRQGVVLQETVHSVEQYLESPDLTKQIIASIEAAEASNRRVQESRASLVKMQSEVDKILAEIGQIQRDGTRLLQRMSFEAMSRTDGLLSEARSEQATSNGPIDQLFSDLYLSSLNYSKLLLGFEVIVDLARTQQLRGTASASAGIRLTLEEKLNDLTWQLIQLPDGPDRTKLASLANDLRQLVLGNGGLFVQLAIQNSLRSDLTDARRTREALVGEISQLAKELVNKAQQQVGVSSEELNAATRTLVWMLAAALILSLGTVLFANVGIIENQINRRMKALNGSVSAIAGGDLDYPISVSGEDELGDMAGALKIFKKNALELRRSNVELEKFAYVAAHDLRSPLRAIHDLSVWTLEDEDNQLSAESEAYLTLLQNRVDRLNRLLNDLLDYARAGQTEAKPQEINLSNLINQLVAGADPDGKFRFSFEGTNIRVTTFVTPLTQIIGNLLSNAVKHHDKSTGVITIGAKLENDRLRLTITDDGPGIHLDYQSKVFELFQTLRPRDEVEGSGLGLAIVSKLAEYFGGSVTLTSDPSKERGARFDVDLPVFQIDKSTHEIANQAAA